MNRAKIAVHHFVANLTTRQYGSNPTSDLLGVDYWFVRPPDIELPIRISRIDLFTRFYLQDAKRATFRVELVWNDNEGIQQIRMATFGPYRVTYPQEATVVDQVFRLNNVYLRRPGMHAIRLLRKRRHRWKGPIWSPVSETHFYLEFR